VGGVSIRPPVFVVGVARLLRGPVRVRPRLFLPALIGVIAFLVGVVLVIPLYCVATSDVGGVSTTVCSSILGPTWSRTGLYNPPPAAFDLAVRDGVVAGVVAAIATLAGLTFRARRRPS
jgi:hypothetical protein